MIQQCNNIGTYSSYSPQPGFPLMPPSAWLASYVHMLMLPLFCKITYSIFFHSMHAKFFAKVASSRNMIVHTERFRNLFNTVMNEKKLNPDSQLFDLQSFNEIIKPGSFYDNYRRILKQMKKQMDEHLKQKSMEKSSDITSSYLSNSKLPYQLSVLFSQLPLHESQIQQLIEAQSIPSNKISALFDKLVKSVNDSTILFMKEFLDVNTQMQYMNFWTRTMSLPYLNIPFFPYLPGYAEAFAKESTSFDLHPQFHSSDQHKSSSKITGALNTIPQSERVKTIAEISSNSPTTDTSSPEKTSNAASKLDDLKPLYIPSSKRVLLNKFNATSTYIPYDPEIHRELKSLIMHLKRKQGYVLYNGGYKSAIKSFQNEVSTNGIPDNLSLRFINGDIGFGVFAKNDIAKESLIGTYNGVYKRGADVQDVTYVFNLDEDNDVPSLVICAKDRGNITRFINHSQNPNIMFYVYIIKEWDVARVENGDEDENKERIEVLFIANKKILKGEQLTLNYGEKYWQSKGYDPKIL